MSQEVPEHVRQAVIAEAEQVLHTARARADIAEHEKRELEARSPFADGGIGLQRAVATAETLRRLARKLDGSD
jgi:hypothetical protein